eukprot:Ihof_evm2s262 gene=Ihof_evmTU2s262
MQRQNIPRASGKAQGTTYHRNPRGPGVIDPYAYRLISKSGPNDSIGISLKDRHEQKKLLDHLVSEMGKQQSVKGFASLLLLFRKLREGVTALSLKDSFAVEVYEQAAHCSIQAGDHAEYYVCVLTLVKELYPAAIPQAPLKDNNKTIGVSDAIITSKSQDTLRRGWACSVAALILHYACVVGSLNDLLPLLATLETSLLKTPEVALSLKLWRALHSVNHMQFYHLCDQVVPSLVPFVPIAQNVIRQQTFSICSKAYLSLPLQDLATMLHFS